MPGGSVSTRIKETSLGPPVAAWLAAEGFDVYQEVEAYAGIADMVGTCGPQLAVVEMKVALSFELLWQAVRWRAVAHQVWVAVPHAKDSTSRRMAERCFEDRGIGVLTVTFRGCEGAHITMDARPEFNRKADVEMVRKRLREQHKTFALAGSVGGSRWTEFKGTVQRLREYAQANPGVLLGTALKETKHHYASDAGARSRLTDLIGKGKVPGLRIEPDGRKVRLFSEHAS
jgi:hypothetical protein